MFNKQIHANQTEFCVNDRVTHVGDTSVKGTIISIDDNLPNNTTTCLVLWDDKQSTNIEWTNRIIPA